MTTIIKTERLMLRTWKKEDVAAYFQINQDPKVFEFLRVLNNIDGGWVSSTDEAG